MSDIPAQIENRNRNQRRSVTRDNAFPIQQGGGYFQILIPAVQPQSSLLPQYLPPDYRTRDRILDSTVRADAMWSAAIGIAITKAAALSWDVKSDIQLRSTRAQELLLNADATNISGIGGWVSYMGKQLRNFTCTNAGCFTEIIRATGAYGSRIVGIGHLSSLRMRRTGDPEYPYIYIDRWGHQHVMRWWQVFNLVDMPDPDEAALGMGLCAAERAYQQIRKLAAIETYIYEKVSGSRPLALHIVNGVTPQQLQDMMRSASENQAQKGLSLYMGAIVATTLKPDAAPSLVTIPLAELPDGFEADKERERADLIYANALGLDPQDLRPISNQQLGAGAQSQVLNQKAEGRGQAAFRQQLTHMLNQLVLDEKTKFIFTEHDYQDQKAAADVSTARAGFVSTLVSGQIITAQQGQQILAEQNEIPKAILEAGVDAGAQLSDTDKPDVEPEFNDQSMPPQPKTLPVMQTQQPAVPSPPAQESGAAGIPNTVIPGTAPKNPFEQKAEPPSRSERLLGRRSVSAQARRLLRQTQGGRITTKGWVTIHGHPVLIGAPDSGGGGSGGAGAVSGSGKGSHGNNTAKHGSGGKSKYPTLDAYKKGQIDHATAMSHLQQDIKNAKLAGDKKAVTTLSTQYYNLKKAGPAPSQTGIPKHDNTLTLPASDGGTHPKTPTSGPDTGKANSVGELSGPHIQAIKGSSVHMYAEGMESQIKGGVASQGDVWDLHAKIDSAISEQKNKVDLANQAIGTAKLNGLAVLPSIQQMKDDAELKVKGYQDLKAHMTSVVQNSIPVHPPVVLPTKSPPKTPLHEDPDVVHAADLKSNNEWTAYDKKVKEIAAKHGISANEAKDAINKAQQMSSGAYQPSLFGSAPKPPTANANPFTPHIAKAQVLQEKLANGQIKKATYNTQMSLLAKQSGMSTTQLKTAANEENQKKLMGTGASSHSPTVSQTIYAPPASMLGTPDHIAKALQIQEKYESGKIAASTYQQSMYKLAKENGMPTQQLYSAVAQHKASHGGVPPTVAAKPAVDMGTQSIALGLHKSLTTGKITQDQFDQNIKQLAADKKLDVDMLKKSVGIPTSTTGGLHKTPNPLPHMTDAQAAKVGAMSPAKQDLIKLGAVYDQHGGQSPEYLAAIEAYNKKHGTTLNYSSAGPEVKKIKQEAGIPIISQAKPAATSSYTPAPAPSYKPITAWKHDEIHNDAPLNGTGMSKDELNSWGLASSKEWTDSLSGPQSSSVKAYTGSAYSSINGQLRAGGQLSSTAKSHISHIDAALDKASMPRPVTTMRGFSSPSLEARMNSGQSLDGAIFHDNGFISSSLNHGSSFGGNVKMKINIPKGAKAAYLGHISGFGTAESEVLLARDANFKIKGYSKVGGQWVIEVDYIGSGPMPTGAFKARD